jgi:hypothetical protein
MEWIGLAVAIAAIVIAILSKLAQTMRVRQQRELEAKRRSLAGLSPVDSPDTAETPHFPTTYPPPTADNTDDLDYTNLVAFLNAQKYEAADRETLSLMLRAAGAEQRGYFELADLETLCDDVLETLDRLWLQASEGRFGFSVQRRLYWDTEGEYSQLGTRVGWVTGGKWFDEESIRYHADAPEGHLPLAPWQSVLASFSFVGLALCLDVLLGRDDWPGRS